MTPAAEAGIHGSCIAFGPERGVLILGPSGSGKSGLALSLMSLGAELVADDRTLLSVRDGRLEARAPIPIAGLIEARGVGLLRVVPLAVARVVLAIDLGIMESDRLPASRQRDFNGIMLPVLHKIEASHFPAAILYYLKGMTRDRS